MLIPTKHENLERNLLVVGAKIIEKLKKNDLLLEELIDILLKEVSDCTTEIIFDALTFLYCVDAITINNYYVGLTR